MVGERHEGQTEAWWLSAWQVTILAAVVVPAIRAIVIGTVPVGRVARSITGNGRPRRGDDVLADRAATAQPPLDQGAGHA